jgi:L-iditol 2-dehydrogenase
VYVAGTGVSPIACGQCFHCIRGETAKCENIKVSLSFSIKGKLVSRFPSGFGEFSFGHEGKAYLLPKNVSYEEAAVTTDLAYVIGVLKRSKAGIGDTVSILGAGPIGLRTLQIAKLAGISKIIVSEPIEYRLKCAEELGADILINPNKMDPIEEVMNATKKEGVNFVFDTTGNLNATIQGLKMLKSGMGGRGTLILMGLYEDPNIQFNISELMFKAGKIITEWGIRVGRNSNIKDALQIMADKKINILKWITHKLPEEKTKEALNMLINKEDKAIGVEIVH